MVKNKNIIIENPETKPFLADAFYPENAENLPLLIFVHGYKGYKDWGAWELMGETFAKAGFYFVKFNFSHNGTTVEQPEDFADLEAFGLDNYTKELSDLGCVIDYFSAQPQVDAQEIALLGHSRGGGIAIIKSFEDERINHLITLAGVDSLNRFPKNEALKDWEEEGVYCVLNGRTKQQMPHYYQFYEDFKANENRFDVEAALEMVKAKILIIHGTEDETVDVNAAQFLHLWNGSAKKILIENANHTFGAQEPWEAPHLPANLELAVEEIIAFFNEDAAS